ncbi:MAG: hypothetical protein HYS74_01410 [Parcubacteria group bacterium]|nr:hypothetical protein [Parcubacteria group bacterium]
MNPETENMPQNGEGIPQEGGMEATPAEGGETPAAPEAPAEEGSSM